MMNGGKIARLPRAHTSRAARGVIGMDIMARQQISQSPRLPIIKAQHFRTIDNKVFRVLLELARMKVIGRITMLDTWRAVRLGKLAFSLPKSLLDQDYPPDIRAFIPRRGEDSGYARQMRMKPETLERVIAIVDGPLDQGLNG
jgi:hypothetical protein